MLCFCLKWTDAIAESDGIGFLYNIDTKNLKNYYESKINLDI